MTVERTSLVTFIGPRRAWLSLGLSDVWAYRELLYFLTVRDLKVRYKQTAIGVLWAILQPGLSTLIFAVVFSQMSRFDSPGVPYPLLVLSGLLLWLFVNNTTLFASNSLIGSSDLVTKVYFPRLLLPIAAVSAGIIDLAIGFVMLLIVMAVYGTGFAASILLAPLFALQAVLLTLGIGAMMAALNVRFRDVKFALPFALQIWMFASPVFYPIEILSDRARQVLSFNPMNGILSGFRSALFGLPFDRQLISISVVVTLVVLAAGSLVFTRMEDDFADVI